MRRLLLLLVFVLALPRVAAAAPGMCGVTGTVYKIDGSLFANGPVIFRSTFTQTFGGDTVAASPEYVTTDGSGNLPGGVQLPLSSRVFITVGTDRPVAVTVTNNAGSCPVTFGSLYGSGLSPNPPAPSTLITSINTVNNFTGLTLQATNPAQAGAATLTTTAAGTTSWTPTIVGSTTNPTVTYTVQFGRYAQLGNFFWWDFYVAWSAFSGGSGSIFVNGFPLVQNNTTNFFAGGMSWNWGGVNIQAQGATYDSIGCQIAPGAQQFAITINSASGGIPSTLLVSSVPNGNGQILCQGWGSL